MSKALVITGCSGFVGSHLLERFLSEGWTIFGWDLEDQKIAPLLDHPNLHFTKSDISSPDALAEMREQVRSSAALISLAALCNPSEYNTRPLDTIRANALDVLPLIDLCAAEGAWLVHFSTSEVYGRTISSYYDPSYANEEHFMLDEDSTPLLMGPVHYQRWSYACAKQFVERYIYASAHEHRMPFTIIRPLNFFGPRMDYLPGQDGDGVPRVLACFMAALLNRTPMYLVEGGSARRTIVSIYDAVDAISRIVQNPSGAQGEIFNIGNPNNEVTIKQLAHLMRRLYSSHKGDPSYLEVPIESVSAASFYGQGYEDCDRRMPSIEKATRKLGWRPSRDLEEVLLDAIADFDLRYSGVHAD